MAGVSPSYEFITKSILLYIEGILFHPPFVFSEKYWASALLAVIMLSHVFNCISVWCSISLVCSELGWVDGDGCVWGCGDLVTFVSHYPIRFFLSYRAMVFRLEPSMIAFSSIFLLVPVLGILSASIGYGLRTMIAWLWLGFHFSNFLPALPV